jgi:ABC-type phosphate/phosphonate transport system substrate-binding protein
MGCIMSIKFSHLLRLVLLLTVISQSTVLAGPLILTAPPRETPEKGEEIFQPIAKYLSKVLGEPVEYRYQTGWIKYTKEMREGMFDVVFDGPHFAAWRRDKLKDLPAVRLPGTLNFLVFANADANNINSMKDLISQGFCGLASPNLATMVVYQQFPNPVVQPGITEIQGGTMDVIKAFEQGKCRTAVVRDKAYYKLPLDERAKYKIIFESRSLPNQTITLSDRISIDKKRLIIQALTSEDGLKVTNKLLSVYSKNDRRFIVADYREYDGLSNLLSGVIWGW